MCSILLQYTTYAHIGLHARLSSIGAELCPTCPYVDTLRLTSFYSALRCASMCGLVLQRPTLPYVVRQCAKCQGMCSVGKSRAKGRVVFSHCMQDLGQSFVCMVRAKGFAYIDLHVCIRPSCPRSRQDARRIVPRVRARSGSTYARKSIPREIDLTS